MLCCATPSLTQGEAGVARLGPARLGPARLGEAWLDVAGQGLHPGVERHIPRPAFSPQIYYKLC
jgi:hypothetical protein